MKRNIYYIMLAMLFFASCDKDTHKGEEGIVVTLTNTTDSIKDIVIWIFTSDNQLKGSYDFASPQEMALTIINLPVGEYTLVATTNLRHGFSHNMGPDTALDDLLISIDDASSSPEHVHFGITTAAMKQGSITRSEVLLNRTMAELEFTINEVPDEVVSAQLRVLNSAKSYYPGTSILSSETEEVNYGVVTPQKGILVFDNKRLMPVIALPKRSRDELTTRIELEFLYDNGGKINFQVEGPPIQNGGIYTPKISYSVLRPGIVVEINDINGWIELPAIEGEILNPNESK